MLHRRQKARFYLKHIRIFWQQAFFSLGLKLYLLTAFSNPQNRIVKTGLCVTLSFRRPELRVSDLPGSPSHIPSLWTESHGGSASPPPTPANASPGPERRAPRRRRTQQGPRLRGRTGGEGTGRAGPAGGERHAHYTHSAAHGGGAGNRHSAVRATGSRGSLSMAWKPLPHLRRTTYGEERSQDQPGVSIWVSAFLQLRAKATFRPLWAYLRRPRATVQGTDDAIYTKGP